MKKISNMVLKAELALTGAMLILIFVLVLTSAVARTIGMPINWAQDISLLLFGWLTFIGADVVIKNNGLIRIDMLVTHFPEAMQKLFTVIFDLMMMLFLLVLAVYGFILVSQSWSSTFNTLQLSYAWCTLAVPVGSLLMMFSIAEKSAADCRSLLNK